MSDTLTDLPARVAVLEEIASGTQAELREMRADIRAVTAGMADLRAEVALLNGRVGQLPTIWQITIALITSLTAFAALLLAAIRFALH